MGRCCGNSTRSAFPKEKSCHYRLHRLKPSPLCLPPLPLCRSVAFFIVTAHNPATAATITLSPQPIPGGYRLTASEEVSSYFVLQSSANLHTFGPIAMDMGAGGAVWDVAGAAARGFWNVRQISVYAPEDTDGDYIDDIYEIQHPVLNPLNAADAALIVPGRSISYLQEYRALFGLGEDPPQVYSREVSSFNFGAPMEAALSREISAFNFGGSNSIEAVSKEVSLFNGQGGPAQGDIPEVYSRELSLFNFDAPPFSVEAVSKELSVFNGEGGPAQGGIPEVYTREVSAFNFGAPVFSVEAISREVSVFNNTAP